VKEVQKNNKNNVSTTPYVYWLRQEQCWLRHQNYVEIKAS